MKEKLLPVVFGAVAALVIVSVAVNLQASQPFGVPAPMFAAKTGPSESTPLRDEAPPRYTPYLALPFALLAAILVYRTAGRILKGNELG
mgnify:CR=1 FL=1